MERISVAMILENLEKLPDIPLPAGYETRLFTGGDDRTWAEIETSAGEFPTEENALERFHSEFGPFADDMKKRCVFVRNAEGRSVGTATAWYNREFRDGVYGRLHWVGIHQDFQGRGLGKPLVSAAMQLLARYHAKAYLTTQTTSAIAIKIYLDFGFAPLFIGESCGRAWKLLAEELRHPALEAYL